MVEQRLTEHAEAIPLCALHRTFSLRALEHQVCCPYHTSAVERPRRAALGRTAHHTYRTRLPLFSDNSDRRGIGIRSDLSPPSTYLAGGEPETPLPVARAQRSAPASVLWPSAARPCEPFALFRILAEDANGFWSKDSGVVSLTSTLRRPFTHPPVIVRVPRPTTVPVPIISRTELTIVCFVDVRNEI